jgi:hypothetical protein
MVMEEPFGWNYKPTEKYSWLIFRDRKLLFRLKNKLNKTNYKPDEHGRSSQLQSTIKHVCMLRRTAPRVYVIYLLLSALLLTLFVHDVSFCFFANTSCTYM